MTHVRARCCAASGLSVCVVVWTGASDRTYMRLSARISPYRVTLYTYDANSVIRDTLSLPGAAGCLRVNGKASGKMLSDANFYAKSVPNICHTFNGESGASRRQDRRLSSICRTRTIVLHNISRAQPQAAQDGLLAALPRAHNFKLGKLFAFGGIFIFQTCPHARAAYPTFPRVYPQHYPRNGDNAAPKRAVGRARRR